MQKKEHEPVEFQIDSQYSLELNPFGGYILKKVFKRKGDTITQRLYGDIPTLGHTYIERKLESKTKKSKQQIKTMEDFINEYKRIGKKFQSAFTNRA